MLQKNKQAMNVFETGRFKLRSFPKMIDPDIDPSRALDVHILLRTNGIHVENQA